MDRGPLRPPFAVLAVVLLLASAVGTLGTHEGSSAAATGVAESAASSAAPDLGGGAARTDVVDRATADERGSPAAPSLGGWLNLTSTLGQPEAPTPAEIRDGATLTFDVADGYFLFFSPTSASDFPTNTWIFDHGSWSEDRNTLQPPAGADTSSEMVYDASDGYVVLFEGAPSYGPSTVTWVYSAGTWSNVTSMSTAKPPERQDSSLAYDGASEVVVLFGGYCAGSCSGNWYFNDTWTFHAGVWANLSNGSVQQPPAREAATLVPLGAAGVLLFGGLRGGSARLLDDWWLLSNNAWQNLTNTSQPHPSARSGAVATEIGPASLPVLFGGSTSSGSLNLDNATWSYSQGRWSNLTANLSGAAPAPLAGSVQPLATCFAYDPVNNFTLLLEATIQFPTDRGYAYALGPSILLFYRVSHPTIDLGQSFTVNATTLPPGANLTFQSPPGCISPSSGNLSCTPSSIGPFLVNLTAAGTNGSPSVVHIRVQVNPAPGIASFSVTPSALTIGNTTRFLVTPENGTPPFTFGYLGYPTGCGSYNSSSMNCTPGVVGTFRITAYAKDAAGLTAYTNATLVVNPRPTSHPLVITPSLIDLGSPVTMEAEVLNGTSPFSYLWFDLPPGCISRDAANLTCTPTTAGTFPIAAVATDTFGWIASSEGTLTVLPALNVSAFTIGPSPSEVGVATALHATVSGGFSPYSYRVSGFPNVCLWVGLSSATCTPALAGNFSVNLTVTDALGASVTESLSLRVAPALVLSTFDVSPSTAEVGQNTTFSAQITGGIGPVDASFGPLTGGAATCRPQGLSALCLWVSAGNVTFGVTLLDALGGVAQGSTSLEVRPAPSVTGVAITPSTAYEGSTVEFALTVQGGVSPYSIEWSGLPPGCPQVFTPSFGCTPSATGTYTVRAIVRDSGGGTAYGSATLTIVATLLGVPVVDLGVGVAVAAVAVAAVWVFRRRRSRPSRRGKDSPGSAEAPAGVGDGPSG